eukprot:s1033_g9.t1
MTAALAHGVKDRPCSERKQAQAGTLMVEEMCWGMKADGEADCARTRKDEKELGEEDKLIEERRRHFEICTFIDLGRIGSLAVCTISGESVLERQFDPVVSLEAVISALGEEEASWQLRLFQDSVELTEDLQLQDLCLKNDKNGGKASREAREARELTLSLVRSSPRTLALTGHCNGSLQLWDLDGRCIHTMGGAKDSKENEHQVTGLEVDWTGLRALSGDLCHNVRLWDLEKGKCLYIMAGHAATIGGVAVDWTRHLAVTHDAAGLLICWNLQTGSQLYLLFAHEGHILVDPPDFRNVT